MAVYGTVSKSRQLCSLLYSSTFWNSSTGITRVLGKRCFQTSLACNFPAFDKEFEKAKERLNSLKEDPGNDAKLKLYALFKQATQGQCNTPKPGMMDFVGGVKWKAWKDLGSMSQDDAQKAYISLVNDLAGAEPPQAAESQGPRVQYDGMKITREGGVFTIQLNRPNKKNAITWQVYAS
ncbi:Enoyl-CoA delta isomerase 2, mitochondrial [Bulinus truncatus]|nr:Enoyl-CoA delta isomerase 2, mitochondrial [Bulinus truncatus]